MSNEFNGFHQGTLDFLSDLKDNNSKTWFEENREAYERYVMEPSRAFVISMGDRLKEISEGIIADPRVNGSLFRMNRDVRFSADKSPYKTNIGIMFWEGGRKRMEAPCYYFHLEPGSLMLGCGIYMFPKAMMDPYRNVVSDPGPARELTDIIGEFENSGIEAGGLHYKRVPRGFEEEYEYSRLLKHNGLYGMRNTDIPEEFFSSALLDMTFEWFVKMEPMNRWFLKYLF